MRLNALANSRKHVIKVRSLLFQGCTCSGLSMPWYYYLNIPARHSIKHPQPLVVVSIGICHIIAPWIPVYTKVTRYQYFFPWEESNAITTRMRRTHPDQLHPVCAIIKHHL